MYILFIHFLANITSSVLSRRGKYVYILGPVWLAFLNPFAIFYISKWTANRLSQLYFAIVLQFILEMLSFLNLVCSPFWASVCLFSSKPYPISVWLPTMTTWAAFISLCYDFQPDRATVPLFLASKPCVLSCFLDSLVRTIEWFKVMWAVYIIFVNPTFYLLEIWDFFSLGYGFVLLLLRFGDGFFLVSFEVVIWDFWWVDSVRFAIICYFVSWFYVWMFLSICLNVLDYMFECWPWKFLFALCCAFFWVFW